MSSAKKKESFENDLEKLEGIVNALEEGGLSLDDALKQFEEGVKLSRKCEKALSEAEKKIEVLTRNAEGDLDTEPFDEEDGPNPSPQKTSSKKKLGDDDDDDWDDHDEQDEHGGGELF